MEFFTWIAAHWMEVLGATTALLSGVVAICMLIPGEQPEKFLQGVLDFLAKFSRKPGGPTPPPAA